MLPEISTDRSLFFFTSETCSNPVQIRSVLRKLLQLAIGLHEIGFRRKTSNLVLESLTRLNFFGLDQAPQIGSQKLDPSCQRLLLLLSFVVDLV
jgi:hypothetical protein